MMMVVSILKCTANEAMAVRNLKRGIRMRYDNNGGHLILMPEGKIDTANSEATEAEINQIRGENAHDTITLDLENIAYISSSGLRVILRLKRAEPTLNIINASSEVYEIFEMTGFSEMMPISKAYRKLSVEGCEIIGEGSNGTVYSYANDIVIKVYKNNDALADIQRERELARTALVLGVNTAIPYDVVKVGDRYGSVFELVSAASITKLIREDPENLNRYVGIFTDLLKEIHNTEVKPGVLPSIRGVYLNYAEFLKAHLDAAHYEKLVSLIEAVPESNYMIHGDYHTNNVLYANNEAILIDMDTLAVGNFVFELASIFLAYEGYNEVDPQSSMQFLKMDAQLCKNIYSMILKNYFRTEDAQKLAAWNDKIRLLGYTRMLRRTIRRQPELVSQIAEVKEKLCALIDSTDDLLI